MHRHQRLFRLVCLGCVALAAGLSLLLSQEGARAAPGAQVAPGGRYVPRPVPIRRLPGGRGLRIVSRTHGGVMNRVCTTAGLDAQGLEFREPRIGEEALRLPVIFLPGSGQLASEINAPVVCVLAEAQAVAATALAPDGQTRLPALLVPEGQLSIVSLPLEAFITPGAWQLEITAPVRADYSITVPPPASPALVVAGDALLLQGYQPDEALRGIVMVNRCMTDSLPRNAPPETLPPLTADDAAACARNQISGLWEGVQLFAATANGQGRALVARIDPDHDLTYAIVGATTPQILATVTFREDLEEAMAAGEFLVVRDLLFAAPEPDATALPTSQPTPAVMPSTGAPAGAPDTVIFVTASAIGLLVVLTLTVTARRRVVRRP